VDGLLGTTLVLLNALVFATAFPVASGARAASEQNSIALGAAQQEIELVRNMPYDSVQSASFATPNLRGGYGYRAVNSVSGTMRLKQVDVHVHWYTGDLPKELTVTTYVTDR
jgi:hypothetical protein